MLNVPEIIYRATDLIILPIVRILVPRSTISNRLKMEQKNFKMEPVEYGFKTLTTIHERASSMVSHLSIMLAMCLYLLQNEKAVPGTFEYWIVLLDTFIYIGLVVLSVRCLRSLGLDRDYPVKEEYEEHLSTELTTKYCIMQIVNSFTIGATLILVLALIIISLNI